MAPAACRRLRGVLSHVTSQEGLSIDELRKLPLDMPPPPQDVPGMAAQFMRDGFLRSCTCRQLCPQKCVPTAST